MMLYLARTVLVHLVSWPGKMYWPWRLLIGLSQGRRGEAAPMLARAGALVVPSSARSIANMQGKA